MVSIPRSSPDVELSRRNRLIIYYLLGIAAVVFLYTALYNYGMRTFEGETYSIFRSLQTVVETMTTTGYGADSPWETPVMNAFMVLMQLTGIGLGFFTLRVIVIPLFTGAEVNLDSRLSAKHDHVIICEYRRDSAILLDEFEELGIDYVLIESDVDAAKALSDEGYSVIDGSPQSASAFERASIDTARAVLTDAREANVNTILTARSVRSDVEIVALTDDPDMREVLSEVGASGVLSPHDALGRHLARKAVSSLGTDLTGAIDLGTDIEVVEVPIPNDSDLVGTTVREAGVRERTGANIIGAWIDGELQLPPDPDAPIRANTVLLVSGHHADVEALGEFIRPARSPDQFERVVIAGAGTVGQAARSVVTDAGIDAVTVDVEDGPGVDVVGDAGSRDVLEEAGIGESGAIVVGLPDDSTALLTAVLSRSMNPDIEVLLRVNDVDATTKALSAGADYVLSVPRVSARMVARELRGEAVLAPASQIRIVRVPATPFVGSTLAESGIYEETGCRVIAVSDDDGVSGIVDPDRRFTGEEEMTIVGTDESVRAFLNRFDITPAASTIIDDGVT
jgi:Trk K+ transport system NAD-binding subunit